MRKRRQWRLVPTDGSPCHVRICSRFAAVPVEDTPTEDLPASLTQVEGFGIARYATSKFAADIALTLEHRSGAVEMSRFGRSYRKVKEGRRIAVVQGEILVADGRTDPAFFGGHARLLHDGRRWQDDDLDDIPVQIKRLRELERADVDVIEFPTNAAVDLRFSRLNLAQPVVVCCNTFRTAVASGRVTVEWS